MFVSVCLYVVLSRVGRGLCDGLITRPEESYRVSNCMCDHRNPLRGLMFQVGNDRKMNESDYRIQPPLIGTVMYSPNNGGRSPVHPRH
jgi:hypothetical protein